MANFYKTTQLTEQSTTSSTFIDVPGASVAFTPSDTGEVWVILASGLMRSSSTSEVAAEMQLLINGSVVDLWGHQNSDATSPNGAGFFTFERITGTVAAQTVKLQYRAATGTSYADDLRLVAFLLPANADFQFAESDGIVSTTGADVTVLTHGWTPATADDYLCFYKMSHHEGPSGSTSQAWIEDVGATPSLRPDAPAGVHHSNSRDAWNPMGGVFKTNLSAALQTFNLKFTSSDSGSGASEHRYRRIMLFRTDVFDEFNYSESVGESTTSSTSFQTKNSLAVSAPPEARDYVSIQCARIGGTKSATVRKAGELRRAGSALARTNHRINRDNTADQGYHHTIGAVDAANEASSVTYANGFLSPDASTVAVAESTIVVLRYPAPVAPVAPANAPFFGMVA